MRSVTAEMLTMWHWEGEVEEGKVDGREGK